MAGGVAVPMADAVEVKPALPPPPPECGGGESGRRSPEFEFWMVGKNPSSFPSPALLTADELFSGGVVLPLHTLQPTDGNGDGDAAVAPDDTEEAAARPLAESGGVAPTPDLPAVTFKWKDIFKANGGAGGGEGNKERKKTERRVSSGNAELININIWPFSRSRSAGAAVSLSRANKPSPSAAATTGVAGNANGAASAPGPTARKVGSAPCSRSSSRGESGGPDEPAVAVAVSAAKAVEEPARGAGAQEQQPHVQGKEVGARTRIRTFFFKKVY